jgi:outer membrane protein assembly factor BamB
VCVLTLLPAAAVADFAPGRLYVTARTGELCDGTNNERIYEFDPATGQTRLFTILPTEHCGGLNGLAFTPDGQHLRASVYRWSEVLEIDGDGNVEVALDVSDGIIGPWGGNNIVYNDVGDFFVVNEGAHNILKFPVGGGPPQLWGALQDGVRAGGPVALAPNGDLLFGVQGVNEVRDSLRFTGPREFEVFDTLPFPVNIDSMAIDSQGRLFVQTGNTGGGLFRWSVDDAGSRVQFNTIGASPHWSSVALSPDESVLYVANNGFVRAVDPDTGASTYIGTVYLDGDFIAGSGMVVAIPEPSSLLLLAIAASVIRVGRGVRARARFTSH